MDGTGAATVSAVGAPMAVAAAFAFAALGAVVLLLAERRYRRVRVEILAREDERVQDVPEPVSPIVELIASRTPPGVDMKSDDDGPGKLRFGGHRLLPDGPEAFAVRLALVDAASRTLDLQYYTWHDDLAGRALARHVLAAAARGVRCRVLLDDLHASGTRALLDKLTGHPLVTVRVFNPSLTRHAYFVHWLLDFRRLNRRMHNKVFVADGIAGITGGRNIGDVYFGLSTEMNFRDCDVLVVGNAARALGASFARYWTGRFAFPSAAFGVKGSADAKTLGADLAALDRAVGQRASTPERMSAPGRSVHVARDRVRADEGLELSDAVGELRWCASRLIDDPPDTPDAGATAVARAMSALLGSARHEIAIEVAYLVPGANGVARLASLAARGVRVRVLTNSFATNDVLAAQAGYAGYRRALLNAGVELHELRPDAPVRRAASLLKGALGKSHRKLPSVAGLHTKALVVDRRVAVLGSFNFDPRSVRDNSEVVLAVEDEAVASELATLLAEGRASDASYRVSIERGRLRWHDRATTLEYEPGLTLPARALAIAVRFLPVEQLL